jgi:hypothetical protein
VASAPFKLALSAAVLAIVLVSGSGCLRAGRLPEQDVTLAPPVPWRPVPPSTWMVPGTPLAAWSGPDGASLVVYRRLPVPGGSAAMLADSIGIGLESLPEVRVVAKESTTIAGAAAARVEAVAPGTGDALAPSVLGKPVAPEGKALVPTRQVTIAFPRPSETVYLVAHMPETAHDQIAPQIDAAIQTVRFTATGKMSSQGYQQ